MAVLTIDLKKIGHNSALVSRHARALGLSIYGVTKVLSGAWQVAQTLKNSGVEAIADSRLMNIAAMREANIPGPYVLLRLPAISEAEQVVVLADISLNSDLDTCQALSKAAIKLGVRHRVILMVDLGDLREGIWPSEFLAFLKSVQSLPGIEVYGIGTNLTCYGGVFPDEKNLGQLISLKEQSQAILGHDLLVSGGNSSTLSLLFENNFPVGITNLRIGEGIILGRETMRREPVAGAYLDACILTAEIIELREKPSVPVGTIGQDAFGNSPQFADRGVRKRAILALGRQDTVPEGLDPHLTGALILGASSDHLIVDVTDSPAVRTGDTLSFSLGYGALLAASTSRYVKKEFI
ncbi:MAG: alanine racemase domain-containing protein [Bacillota bacterium]|nr:MAG: alanine racemase domain-containing protein [Bacillota bacterium]MBS3949080.1 alanine/ornithine racemase family PLP-dependent enzyme [Peptococcaceae bacterium]